MVLEEKQIHTKNIDIGFVEETKGILIIFFPGYILHLIELFKKKVGSCHEPCGRVSPNALPRIEANPAIPQVGS